MATGTVRKSPERVTYGETIGLNPTVQKQYCGGPGRSDCVPPHTHMFMEIEMTGEPAVQISYEDQGYQSHILLAGRVEGGNGEGELTILRVSEALIIADDALVPDTKRGTGAASASAGFTLRKGLR